MRVCVFAEAATGGAVPAGGYAIDNNAAGGKISDRVECNEDAETGRNKNDSEEAKARIITDTERNALDREFRVMAEMIERYRKDAAQGSKDAEEKLRAYAALNKAEVVAGCKWHYFITNGCAVICCDWLKKGNPGCWWCPSISDTIDGDVAIPSHIGGKCVVKVDDFSLAGTKMMTLTIPIGVTCIGNFAFLHCDGLMSIIMPDGVMSIGEGAFRSTALKTVYVAPGDVERIKKLFVDSGHKIDSIEFVERKVD